MKDNDRLLLMKNGLNGPLLPLLRPRHTQTKRSTKITTKNYNICTRLMNNSASSPYTNHFLYPLCARVFALFFFLFCKCRWWYESKRNPPTPPFVLFFLSFLYRIFLHHWQILLCNNGCLPMSACVRACVYKNVIKEPLAAKSRWHLRKF